VSALTCPWCQAPRAEGPSCPKCGANYAKAEAIKSQGRAAAPAEPARAEASPQSRILDLTNAVDPEERVDSELELKFCIAAIPAFLALGFVMHLVLPGVQRLAFTMPVHELGHAVAAWFCGYFAIPTLWVTLMFGERGFLMPLVLAGLFGWLGLRAWRAEKWLHVALCAGAIALVAIGSFGLKERTARMLFAFGGDALGMVIGALLMASFFFGKGTQLYRGALRWGFGVIGGGAFVSIFALWWGARTDTGLIPFGEQERAGHSDATTLTEEFAWTDEQLVSRHVMVGVASLAALALVYAWGVWRAWRYTR
jgi:hypothetical protein